MRGSKATGYWGRSAKAHSLQPVFAPVNRVARGAQRAGETGRADPPGDRRLSSLASVGNMPAGSGIGYLWSVARKF